MNAIPRPEHPRPQFKRDTWINLNGEWSFDFDFGGSGRDKGRELFHSKGFDKKITVPFCPESPLSGVGYKDFISDMWYHRKVAIPAAWDGMRVILHFGGVDYECEAYIDGESVANPHFGGSASFEFDITPFVRAGAEHDLVVRVHDDPRHSGQPRGKQCDQFKSHGCSYTRTTGIWQTV
ncbi:MAG: beta-glucuronidase, partial [Kiritimatiellae bacterium]|nr:beta-glucuronidase [Kiritimatiellia bacterium]